MLDYTRAALKKTVDDIKRLVFIYTIASLLLYIAYLVFASITGIGHLYANIALAAISVAYLIFYIIAGVQKYKGTASKKVKHFYKWAKITLNAFTLGIAIYGAFSNAASGETVIITALLFVVWAIQVIFELLSIAIERRLTLFSAALSKDFAPVMNIYNKVTGKESAPQEDDSRLDKLEKMVQEGRANKINLGREIVSGLAGFVKSKFTRKKNSEENNEEREFTRK